jgi:ATP-binding cassette, subfamily C (CFTR/MRP), member 1
MNSAKVGLILTYALSIIPQLQAMFRTTAEIETNIVAVERLKEYIDLPTEDEKCGDILEECPDDWPVNGEIVFKNFYMTYRSDYMPALKNISLTIKGGQKVGIIGRTGAGKSSLISALIRIIKQSEGTLTIDGQDISQINLQHLRRQITIVPQESLLFSGTLRFNLDPHNKYDDETILFVLEKCRLSGLLEKHNGSLSFEIDGKKNNLSVGEKQMLCLARALLRKSKIMIFDEATSSVDENNEEHLQKVIKEDLKDCTVLTIAHRLSNVKDCDQIIVIDNGQVIECDSPRNLLKNVNSYFYKNLNKE